MVKLVRLIATLSLLVAGTTVPCQADDIPEAAQALLGSLQEQFQREPHYETLTTDAAGQVTIDKLTFGNGDFVATADRLVLGPATDLGDDLYEISNVDITGITIAVKIPELAMPFTFRAPETKAKHWYVQRLQPDSSAAERFRAGLLNPRNMIAEDVVLSIGEFDFHADRFEGRWEGDPRTSSGVWTAAIVNVTAPAALLANAPPDSPFKLAGYDHLSFDLVASSNAAVREDAFDLKMDLNVTGHDIGKLSFLIAGADLPFAALDELERADKAGEEPDFSGMLPRMQKAAFLGAELRFDDHSVTKRLLPIAAKAQGINEQQLIAMAAPMVQMALMQFQSPDFSSQAAAAVNAFLTEPKSITLAIKPTTPVTWTDLMAMDPDAFGAAYKRFGVAVRAND